MPVTINQSHVIDGVKGTRDIEHNISREILKQLPELLEKPIAIIESQTDAKSSLVVIIKAIVNKKPYIAPVYVSSTSLMNNMILDSNNIATLFQKGNAIDKLMEDAIKKEKAGSASVYYWDKTEARTLYALAGVQFSGEPIKDGLNHSIFDANSPVKAQYLPQTETKQFKRWFGKSKIVNKDGSPKIVYHGTNGGDFNVFDWSRTQRADAGWYGRGFYFATGEGEAKAYGDRVVAAYLKLEKPFVFDKEMHDHNGKKTNGVKAKAIAFMANAAKKFPAIWGNKTLEVYDQTTGNDVEVHWKTIGNLVDSYVNDKKMSLLEFGDGQYKWQIQYGDGMFDTAQSPDYYATRAEAEADQWSFAAQTLFSQKYSCKLPLSPEAHYLGGDMNAADAFTEALKQQGYDGVMQAENGDEIVVFDPTHIKSATDNVGLFDKKNPDIRYSLRETEGSVDTEMEESRKKYAGKNLAYDSSLYDYDFLASLPDMRVTQMAEVNSVQANNKIVTENVIDLAQKNGAQYGVANENRITVKNYYTGRNIRLTTKALRHGLSRSKHAAQLANARAAAKAGDLLVNAVPINALYNTSEAANGTYAMAALMENSDGGSKQIAVLTIEQRNNDVVDFEVYDTLHAISTRKWNAGDLKTQSKNSIKRSTTISIADLLSIVKDTHQKRYRKCLMVIPPSQRPKRLFRIPR